MRERKITLNQLDKGFTARVIERPYGGTDWMLCEEYDVTSAIQEIVNLQLAPLKAMLSEYEAEREAAYAGPQIIDGDV